jgi:proline iminopeptidase
VLWLGVSAWLIWALLTPVVVWLANDGRSTRGATPVLRRVLGRLALCSASACTGVPRSDQPREQLLSVNGTELFVKRIGRGEPIIVIHGGPVLEHGYLLPHLAPLAEQYEVVFFDQRLSGRSAGRVDSASVRLSAFVEDIEAIRAALALERVHVIGHSWGGLLAMAYALDHQDRVQSLTLLNSMPASASIWQREEAAQAALETPADSVDAAALRATAAYRARDPAAIAAMLGISFRQLFADRAQADRLRLYVPPDYGERARQFGHIGTDLAEFDYTPRLGALLVPTLIVYGDLEPAATMSGPALQSAIRQSELEVISNAGHFPFVEQSTATLRVVRSFLASRRVRERAAASGHDSPPRI